MSRRGPIKLALDTVGFVIALGLITATLALAFGGCVVMLAL